MMSVPAALAGCVVTIGVFDGLHRGHQALISQAVKRSRELGVPCVMCTFDPHPISVFLPQSAPTQLTTVEQRVRLAEELGVDHVLVIDFTSELAGLAPRLYFRSLIVDVLRARAVFVGENFTFGKDAQGTTTTLSELGREFGVEVHVVDLFCDDGQRMCSSLVREYLAAGDVKGASWVLGRPFSVTAKIVHGAGRGGAQLGYPTANQYFPQSMALPADAVYCGWLTVVDADDIAGDMEPHVRYPAAISVGTNPTFGEDPRSVESYVLDQESDLYGHTARVEFIDHIRQMRKFNGVDELLEAIAGDVAAAREILQP